MLIVNVYLVKKELASSVNSHFKRIVNVKYGPLNIKVH